MYPWMVFTICSIEWDARVVWWLSANRVRIQPLALLVSQKDSRLKIGSAWG